MLRLSLVPSCALQLTKYLHTCCLSITLGPRGHCCCHFTDENTEDQMTCLPATSLSRRTSQRHPAHCLPFRVLSGVWVQGSRV